MTEMHSSMQKLVNAQEEMRAQIEVLQGHGECVTTSLTTHTTP